MRRTYKVGIFLVLGFFAVIYARSLTFVYVEGDDATSIAYHALGRQRVLQPPYSSYQSMMDSVLAVLPPREPVLRVAAMVMTSLAAPLLVLLMVVLAFDWAGDRIKIPWAAAAIVVPLVVPELIYLGLVYTPALVAMAAVVGAHVVVRRALRRCERPLASPRLWGAALLFGAGAACRWDVLAYGAVIAADIWLGPGLERDASPGWKRMRLFTAALWGAAAGVAWLAVIASNGYGISTVLKTVRASGPVEAYPSLPVVAANMQPFATPALVLFAAAGLLTLARSRHRLAILAVLGLALTARVARFGVPKWFLVAAPGIVACALVGLSTLWQIRTRGWTAVGVRAALLAAVLAPWAIGAQAVFGDSAYGPGFQARQSDQSAPAHVGVRAVWGPGALVPTSEGPRPVGGHGWVLLGHGWREFTLARSADLAGAIHEALATGRPVLADNGQGYITATLAGMGFTTRDPWTRTIADSFLEERRFFAADGRRIRVLHLRDRESLFTPAGLGRLHNLAGSDVVVVFGYTSTLRRCYKLAPDSLSNLGVTAALLDLGRLHAAAGK